MFPRLDMSTSLIAPSAFMEIYVCVCPERDDSKCIAVLTAYESWGPAQQGSALILCLPFPFPLGFEASLRAALLTPAAAGALLSVLMLLLLLLLLVRRFPLVFCLTLPALVRLDNFAGLLAVGFRDAVSVLDGRVGVLAPFSEVVGSLYDSPGIGVSCLVFSKRG